MADKSGTASLNPHTLKILELDRLPANDTQSTTSLRKDLNISILFILASFYYILCIGFGSPPEDAPTRQIFNYSHLALPILAVGVAVVPWRVIWLSFVVFAVCFVSSEMIIIGDVSTPGWSALGLLSSMVVTIVTGVIGGGFVRYKMAKTSRSSPAYYPEKVAFIGAAVLMVSGIVLGSIALVVALWGEETMQHIATMQFLMGQRIMRLSLVAGGMILFVFSLPIKRSGIYEIAAQISLFVLLGVLEQNGVTFMQSVDAAMLAVVLILLRPVHLSVAGILAGLCFYVLLTGAYLNLPMDFTRQDLERDVIGNMLYLIVLAVAVLRVQSIRVARNQLLTLGRRARAQELARFGYYLYDISIERIYFDSFSCKILNVDEQMNPEEFLRRIHPDDRDAVFMGTRDPKNVDGASFVIRLAVDGDWHESAHVRQYNGFAITETRLEGQNLAYGIVVDVTHEYAKEEQLRHVLAELSERQGQQTRLFSMISHELRTPAAALSMMADELDDGQKWHNIGPQMRAVLDQLLSILGDMRQTVRPEENLPIRYEALRPIDLMTAVKDTLRGLAAAHNVDVVLVADDAAEKTHDVDRVRLMQTLTNLVKNAILHAQASEIILHYTQEPFGMAVWTVSDNGRNISPEHREALFQPFARGAGDGAHVDGSGLGLYISKAAIELLGGTLDYVYRPISGAEFRIAIPLNGAAPYSDAVNADAEALPPLSLLLVEDSEIMGALMQARLQKQFSEVTWVKSGAEALLYFEANTADVVISDLFMPNVTGDELARKLRGGGFSGKIIGMTAADIPEDIRRFKTAGADSVLVKPLRIDQLNAELKRVYKTAPIDLRGKV